MPATRPIALGAIAFVLVTAACGNDIVTPKEPLAEQEAVGLYQSVRGLLADETPTLIHASRDSVVIACPLGGQARITGTIAEERSGDTERVATDILFTPVDCKVSNDGVAYTLNGDPNVSDRVSAEVVGFFDRVDIVGATHGTVAWAAEGRSGTCEIDLVLTAETDRANPNRPAVRGTYGGSVCGYPVSIDVSQAGIDPQSAGADRAGRIASATAPMSVPVPQGGPAGPSPGSTGRVASDS